MKRAMHTIALVLGGVCLLAGAYAVITQQWAMMGAGV